MWRVIWSNLPYPAVGRWVGSDGKIPDFNVLSFPKTGFSPFQMSAFLLHCNTGFNADDLDLLNFLYDDESGLVTFNKYLLMKAKQNY